MDDGLDELFAGSDAPAAESTAIEQSAPGTEDSPTDEVVADAAPEPLPEAEPPAPQPEPAQAPQAPEWNSPENPHFQAAQQLAALRQLAAQEAQRQQAEKLRQQWTDLTGGDAETAQQFGQIVQQVTAPLQARAQQAGQAEKALTAFHIAAKANLTPEQLDAVMAEMGELMALEGAPVMETHATGKRAREGVYRQQIGTLQEQIAELQKQLSARGELAERAASGADRVDGGNGVAGLSRRERMEQAQTDDDFFAAMFSAS